MLSIRRVIGFIESKIFFGYNEKLETHKEEKIPTTFVFGEKAYKNLYIIDYDANFLLLSDDKGVVIPYNRAGLMSFCETKKTAGTNES